MMRWYIVDMNMSDPKIFKQDWFKIRLSVLAWALAGSFFWTTTPKGETEKMDNRHLYHCKKLIVKNTVSHRVVDHQCICRNRNKRLGYKWMSTRCVLFSFIFVKKKNSFFLARLTIHDFFSQRIPTIETSRRRSTTTSHWH